MNCQEITLEQYKVGVQRLSEMEGRSDKIDRKYMTLIAMVAALFGALIQMKFSDDPAKALQGLVYASGIEAVLAGIWFMSARGCREKICRLKERIADVEKRLPQLK